MLRTYHVTTFGCQMNARDSEKLEGILETLGYIKEDTEEASDIVIFNTCTVRENANERLYGHLGQLKNIKAKNPDMLIGICGCMMQDKKAVDYIKAHFPFVSLIFGTYNLHDLANLLDRAIASPKMIVDIWDKEKEIVEDVPSIRHFKYKASVNISFGCDNFCSYCIVPYVRGRERSRLPEDIICECENLVEDGVVEIMLLGQNVDSYGKGLDTEIKFHELLARVAEIPGLKRVRFMTSHPKDISMELIKTMAKYDNICNHIHLPLQSGSDRILKIMNRHYTKERYLEIVKNIRNILPDAAITTDIIVGFPGETYDDFSETIDVVKKVHYDSAFTFIYSKRSMTPAAKMENQVAEDDVKKWFPILLEAVKEESKKQYEKRIGDTVSVLVEEENRKLEGFVTGRTKQNFLVHFLGKKEWIGQEVDVKLTESKGFYYIGELV